MIGTTLKNLLDEREIKVNEFARQIKVPAQTLYSIIRRDNMKIDFELLLRICDALHVPLETFCGTGSTGQPTPEEWETLWKLRRLDDHGRFVTLQLLDAECARLQAAQRQPERNKIIPLYMTPAAAGYASPALGDDYEDYEVAADSEADFAVRIAGDSMEPYIHDDSIVLVKRGATIFDGRRFLPIIAKNRPRFNCFCEVFRNGLPNAANRRIMQRHFQKTEAPL